jgi:maleate isomerase
MTDSLGYRMKFAVVAPSTNTSVEPEYAAMQPRGVTNHFSRIPIPDTKISDDASFMVMLQGCVVMGMSAETFWDGAEGADRLHKKLVERSGGLPVIMGSTAVDAAVKAYAKSHGEIRRIGIITPYMPVGDANVRKFFEDQGYEVVKLVGLKSSSPMLISHESKQSLKRAAIEVAQGVDAIIQAGTNLAFAEVAAIAEFWLEKPVIAINTATYWHALRSMGINDQVDGFGHLLANC